MSWPHSLSVSRILAGPLVALLVLAGRPDALVVATALFALASLTDLLDGPLARRRQAVGPLGVYLDTTADKIFVSVVLIGLGLAHLVDGWIVMLIVGREFLISGARTVAAVQGFVLTANFAGKVKTTVTMAAITLVMLVAGVRSEGMLSSVSQARVLDGLAWWAMVVAAVLTVISGVTYLVDARRLATGHEIEGRKPRADVAHLPGPAGTDAVT